MADILCDTQSKPLGSGLLPALVLGLAAFLTQFDITAVVVAMPAIATELGFGVSASAWVMDAYSLAFTGTLLAAGALADKWGRRRALLAGNLVFLAGSLACGAATAAPMLLLARAVQGVGAAFVVTGGIALLAGLYERPEERARAFALMGVLSGVAMAVGPTAGGLLSDWVGWRTIFIINIPFCLLILLAVPRLLAEARSSERRPLDWIGIALLTCALGIAIETLLSRPSSAIRIAVGLGASAGLVMIFIRQQSRRAVPILDPGVFGQPAMIAISSLLLAVSIAYWAVLVFLPPFLDARFGWSRSAAGFALLPATLPMLLVPPYGARLVARWGWRRLFAIAMAVMVAGDLLLASAAGNWLGQTGAGLVTAPAGMALVGLGAALAHPQLSGAVVALMPPAQAGVASAVTVVMRQAGFAMGIAILGATLPDQPTAASYAWPWLLAVLAAIGGLAAAPALPVRRD
jgi:MFS family permease